MKTDNSYLHEKINIRLLALPKKKDIQVLDCFSGTGYLWNKVKDKTGKNIRVLSIEMQKGKNPLALSGNNLKYLTKLDISIYDIIDLDAYGVPYSQLEIIFNKGYKGIVVVTFIQSILGGLPKKMLTQLGYSDTMIGKIPSIFYRNGIDKFKNYLYICGVKSITGYFIGGKNYFMFNI